MKEEQEAMPTEHFLKLPEEKRNRILKAAFDEYCRNPLSKVSINNIIRDAGISRGSFYTYFRDKTDLMMFLLEKLANDYMETMAALMDETGGDPFESARRIYETMRDRMQFEKRLSFLKNIFVEPGGGILKAAFESESEEVNRVMSSFAESMGRHLDLKRYPLDKEQQKHLLPMITMLAIHWAAVSVSDPSRERWAKECLEVDLNLLKYGALRRDKKDEAPEKA